MSKSEVVAKNVQKILKEWVHVLGLCDWTVKAHIVKDMGEGRDNNCVAGACYAKWQYRRIEIDLNKKLIKEMDYKELEVVVLHELIHGVVAEMHDMALDDNHKERVVTHLTDAFLWTRGKKNGKL
jgi:hypothetical protein